MGSGESQNGGGSNREGAISRPHHRRFVLIANCFEEEGSVDTEQEVARLRRPDLVFRQGTMPYIFQPLHDRMKNRAVVVEHFSSSLSKDARQRTLSLVLTMRVMHRQWRTRDRKSEHVFAGEQPPLLVVVSPARPVLLEQHGILAPDDKEPGLWCGLGDFAELIYLWVYGLSDGERGWDLLRLTFPPHPSTGYDDRYLRFFLDESRPAEEKKQLMRLMMSEQMSAPKEGSYWEAFMEGRRKAREAGMQVGREEGLEEGRQVGLEEGRQEARERLLTQREEQLTKIVKSFASDDELAKVKALDDTEERVQALTEMIEKKVSGNG
jgi:hypothetical protein